MGYKNSKLDRTFEANKLINIIRYTTLNKLLAAEYNMPISGVKKCKHGGFDGDGKEYEFTFEEMTKSIKRMGCYGFCGDKQDIHIWVSKKANPVDVIALLAHERGHLIRPYNKNPMDEEIKAELYGLCAEFAYRVFTDLKVCDE